MWCGVISRNRARSVTRQEHVTTQSLITREVAVRLAVVTLTVGMVLNISVLASGQSLTERGTHPFEIEFPQSVDIGMLQIGYFSTGSFGGYGEYVFEKSGEHRILLHTVVKGITATSLKAIVYVPGCQIVTIDVSDLARSRHEFSFQCTFLPTLTLRGKIRS